MKRTATEKSLTSIILEILRMDEENRNRKKFDFRHLKFSKTIAAFWQSHYACCWFLYQVKARFTSGGRVNVQPKSSIPIGAKVEISPKGLKSGVKAEIQKKTFHCALSTNNCWTLCIGIDPSPMYRDRWWLFFPILCIDKRQKLKKREKRCKYAKDRLQSFETVPSKMWKTGPGHISEGTFSNYWNIQARVGPENTKGKSPLVFTALFWPQGWKNDTIKFGRPICNSLGQCSSIY